jgi:antitoxin (DNA-binding transcriptional repressor) of toxin-antitoxin stability system
VIGYNAGMSTISLQDLAHNPAALLDRVEAGERLIVLRGGRPVAELRPVTPVRQTPRPFGLAAGAFAVPDDFDAPLPDDILREFEGR